MLYSIREEEWYDNIYICDYEQIITEKYNILKGCILKCFPFI